jgi:hypothetical protein
MINFFNNIEYKSNNMNYELREIREKVNIALKILFKIDADLLDIDVNERSISHKLAEYLQDQFPDWNVDCEYNKKGNATKKLIGIQECGENIRTDRVYPDIIVHQRKKENNLLVIEIKKNTNKYNPICDQEKLKLFTYEKGEYHYSLGLFIKFNQTAEPEFIWYKNGREINF